MKKPKIWCVFICCFFMPLTIIVFRLLPYKQLEKFACFMFNVSSINELKIPDYVTTPE